MVVRKFSGKQRVFIKYYLIKEKSYNAFGRRGNFESAVKENM